MRAKRGEADKMLQEALQEALRDKETAEREVRSAPASVASVASTGNFGSDSDTQSGNTDHVTESPIRRAQSARAAPEPRREVARVTALLQELKSKNVELEKALRAPRVLSGSRAQHASICEYFVHRTLALTSFRACS